MSEGVFHLYQKPSDGTGEEAEVLRTSGTKQLYSWSADGKYLVYDEIGSSTRRDLWILPVAPVGKPIPFLNSEFSESHGQISPDGRWMAYQSDESERSEIYIPPFDKSGGKYRCPQGEAANRYGTVTGANSLRCPCSPSGFPDPYRRQRDVRYQ
jgi:hypothetical protein